jgi:predicted DNA-binding transcriptional regulator AlpA
MSPSQQLSDMTFAPFCSTKKHMFSERPQLGEKRPVQVLTAQPTPLLTLDRVAELLGVSKAWVRDHATRRNPRLPVVRLGGKRAILRFRPQDIENFIDAHLQVQEAGV